MKKYEEGDVIFKDGLTYMCQMADEQRAIFKEVRYPLFGNSSWPSLNSERMIQDPKWVSLQDKKCVGVTTHDDGHRTSDNITDYAIIGKGRVNCAGCVKWDLGAVWKIPTLRDALFSTLSSLKEREDVKLPGYQSPPNMLADTNKNIVPQTVKKAVKKSAKKLARKKR